MLGGVRKILGLLDRRQRRHLFAIVGLMGLMGLMDLAGVAAILPFLAVVANPDAIESQAWMRALYDGLGYETTAAFLRLLGVIVLIVVLAGIALRAATFYAVTRFTRRTGYNLANALMAHYVAKPYAWFLGRHSSDLAKTILAEATQVVTNSVGPIMRLGANGTVIAILLGFLIWLEPVVTLATVGLMGGTFGGVYLVLRVQLLRIGAERRDAVQARFKIVQESMTGIKVVKLMGLEDTYLDRFSEPSWRLNRHMASLSLVREMPRYALEAITFGGMLMFVIWLMWSADGDLAAVLPTIGAFAFAGLKLMPTMQAVFADVAMVRFGAPVLDEVHAELELAAAPIGSPARRRARRASAAPMGVADAIRLRDVRYRYPGADRDALRGVTLEIPARTSVGIVGTSGAGKTTLVDIVLGLLRPDGGHLDVDGTVLDGSNLAAWQATVGYVPQTIYLSDGTVAENVAFGLPPEDVDRDRVRRACELARLTDVVADLPHGLDTPIGEAGVRLSGGQRQRIGIARALYRDPDVLVLDEAMSALDTVTERAVMDAVNGLRGAKTLIVVTHRLSTITDCDRIVMLSRGRIEMEGDYASLRDRSAGFRALAQAAE